MNASDMLNTCKSNVVFGYTTVEEGAWESAKQFGVDPKETKALLLFDKAKKRSFLESLRIYWLGKG
jgi:hypothetical protein